MRQAARSSAHFSQKLSTWPPSSTAPLLTVTLICVRPALSSQATSFSISCCNSVSFHMVWPLSHAVWDRRFSSRVYQSLQRGNLPQGQNENRSESCMRRGSGHPRRREGHQEN